MLASTQSRACWQEVHLVCSHWDRFSFHMWPVASRTWSKRSRHYATVETCRTWFSVFVILNHQAPVPVSRANSLLWLGALARTSVFNFLWHFLTATARRRLRGDAAVRRRAATARASGGTLSWRCPLLFPVWCVQMNRFCPPHRRWLIQLKKKIKYSTGWLADSISQFKTFVGGKLRFETQTKHFTLILNAFDLDWEATTGEEGPAVKQPRVVHQTTLVAEMCSGSVEAPASEYVWLLRRWEKALSLTSNVPCQDNLCRHTSELRCNQLASCQCVPCWLCTALMCCYIWFKLMCWGLSGSQKADLYLHQIPWHRTVAVGPQKINVLRHMIKSCR